MALTAQQQAKLGALKTKFEQGMQGNSKLSHIYKFFNDKAYRSQFIKDRRAAQGGAGGFTPGVAPQVPRPPVAPMHDDPNRGYRRGGKVAKATPKPGVSDKLVRRAAGQTPGSKNPVKALPTAMKKGGKVPNFAKGKGTGKPNPFAKTSKGGKTPAKGKANPFAKGNPFAKSKGKSRARPFKKFS